ncbi:MAG: DNA photolyase family protein [Marinibacterium sp.]|nr:DNA photolyase family protein [Marinibacterium sp.]
MTTTQPPVLIWFRRDLRLADHQALMAACATGQPVLPVFVLDPETEGIGAAALFRLGLSIGALARDLQARGSRLILRRGPALDCLRDLIAETGAQAVHWSRAYDPASIARDTQVKAALKADGIAARSFRGHLLFEPWDVSNKAGGIYKVYSPFWKAVRGRDVDALIPAPAHLPAPAHWPASDDLGNWRLDAAMNCGAAVVAAHAVVGEAAAQARLDRFVDTAIARYRSDRDSPALDACSGLSENLTYGEISPHRVWAAGARALEAGSAGAEHFQKELVWREFAYHLMHHTPHILQDNWKDGWAGFGWATDPDAPEVVAWKQGRTGIPFVDAAMREMYVTGRMHNRARMIVASYLTKHLLTDWRIGMAWFADCLTDWDPAANAMGWQWVAGCGPDAAPYFRVFNPVTQRDKFDPDQRYVRAWIAEGQRQPPQSALSYFDAIPRSWGLSHRDLYPVPVISPDMGRKRALAAYEAWKQGQTGHTGLDATPVAT